MFEEIAFSREAKLVYAEAADIARRAGKTFDSAHILLAIFTVPCEAQSILIEKHTDCDRVLNALPGVGAETNETVSVIYSAAAQIAANVGSRQVTSVHLLMGVSRVPSSRAARALEKSGLPLYALRTQAMAHLTDPRMKRAATERLASMGGVTPTAIAPVPPPAPGPRIALVPNQGPASAAAAPAAFSRPARPVAVADDEPVAFDEELIESEPGDTGEPDRTPVRVRAAGRFALDPAVYPTLATLGRNLTAEAEDGALDPLVGRDDALDAVVDILCKRRSNNPLLLGDPGVGKTALVEGLATLVVTRGDAIPGLAGKAIVAISVSDLLAGTAMRGSFAARLKALKDEVLAADRQVILFIDEIHTLIGAGVGDGGMDAANDLKGALARGQFPCIGATTFGEYKRYILSDDALRRRFEAVYLREPSLEDAERILQGVAPRYADYHGVRFGDDAIRAAVRLTDRVIPDRSLPAKAIDLLDRAGARVRREGKAEVDREDIVAVLSALVDLPREFLTLSPSERFRGMEAALRDRVFGHDEALAAVVRALAQNWARFGSRRPLGSFLLAGPAGAGKRTAAVAIAEWLFGSSQAVLEVDLADYAESHSLSHLIGSPPGYVGHEEGGLLAETLIRRPFLLILWQHVESANPTVLSLLGQILSEGTATDRKGRRMDFRNTVHVLTVAEGEGAGRPVGFGAARAPDEVRARLKKTVPSEVLGAVDQVLALGPLDAAALRKVAGRVVAAAATAFRDEHGAALTVDDEVVDALAAHAAGRGGGGGLVESLVADRILRPATDAIFGDPASRVAGLRASLAGQGRDGVEVAVRTAE